MLKCPWCGREMYKGQIACVCGYDIGKPPRKPTDDAARIAETSRRCRKYATSLPWSPEIEEKVRQDTEKGGEKMTFCPRCNREVEPKLETRTEPVFVHSWTVKTFTCPTCGKILGRRQTRTDRLKTRW